MRYFGVRGKKRLNPTRASVQSQQKLWRAIELLESRTLLSSATPAGGTSPGTLTPLALTAHAATGPSVTETSPAAGATNVRRDGFISADVFGPNGGILPSTLGADTVYLTRNDTGARV